nr:MAG TPA: YonK protein [Caudoviricetes sp.]
MAKDKYKQTTTIDIVGTLDLDAEDNLKITIWKEDEFEKIDVREIFERNLGKQIALKISNEEDLIDG